MRWLRENWIGVVGSLLIVSAVSGWLSTARLLGRAEELQDDLGRRTEEIEGQRRVIRQNAEDRLRRDSVDAAARERSETLRDSLGVLAGALEAVSDTLQDVRDDLTVEGDSLYVEASQVGSRLGQVPFDLFRAYARAMRGALAAANEAIEVEASRADTEADRADEAEASEQRALSAAERLRVDVSELEVFAGDLEARHEVALETIDVLERAVAPSFGVRIFRNWEVVLSALGIGGVIGWTLAK